MDLIWHDLPRLERPALVLAFKGWSDAGEAGTWSVGWLQRHYKAQALATLPGESFLLLSERRPRVNTGADGERTVTWPDYHLNYARIPGGRDLVLLTGPEPHLRWKSFTAA